MLTSYQPVSRPVELFPKSLFSVGEAAAYLGVSASTVRRRIAAGEVRAHRWGRSLIVLRADLDDCYLQCQAYPAADLRLCAPLRRSTHHPLPLASRLRSALALRSAMVERMVDSSRSRNRQYHQSGTSGPRLRLM